MDCRGKPPPPASRWAAPFMQQKPAPAGDLACGAPLRPAADPRICPVPISIICRMLSPRHTAEDCRKQRTEEEGDQEGGKRGHGRGQGEQKRDKSKK